MIRMRAIIPKTIDITKADREFKEALDSTLKIAEREFNKTTKTWDHQVRWSKQIYQTPVGPGGVYETDDDIYRWLNNGTKGPYKIPKAGPGLLAFPSGYRAKTVPNLVYSRGGGAYGPMVFVNGQVTHPGIKPRNFDTEVAKVVMPWFVKYGNTAMKKFRDSCGHAI